MSHLLEQKWIQMGHANINGKQEQFGPNERSFLSKHHWIIDEALLSKTILEPWENIVKHWIHAFRTATTSAERQLACYRFIFELFQSPTHCHYLDCRAIIIAQEDPQKKEDLENFLQWIGIYWPLQAIDLHPKDGLEIGRAHV